MGRFHGVGRYRRRRFGIGRVSFTQGTRGLVDEALEGFGLVRAVALGLVRLGRGWRGRSPHRALEPGEVQDDEEPDKCAQDQLREKMR